MRTDDDSRERQGMKGTQSFDVNNKKDENLPERRQASLKDQRGAVWSRLMSTGIIPTIVDGRNGEERDELFRDDDEAP